MTESLRGLYPITLGRSDALVRLSIWMRGVITQRRQSQRTLRELDQAVELQVADSNQVGVTHRVVLDVRAVEHQAVGLNQVVVSHRAVNRLVHRLRRMALRKHHEISDKDALVPHILGREIGSDRSSNHL